MNDYYQVLGISKTATADEIKKAYRRQALQYHPDRNKTKEADAKFKEVTKAYEVLSDTQKRQTYDQFGASAFDQGGAGTGQGPFGGGNPFSGGQQSGQYGPFTYTYTNGGNNQGPDFDFGGFSDPFDIFEQFFGGARQRQQRRQVYSLTIDFMEAVHGVSKRISLNGKTQTIKIPQGVDNDSRIRFGEYDVVLAVRSDKKFQRQGYNIILELPLSFTQAITGTEIDVDTVDGKVKLKIPSGTQPDTVIRLRGRGVKHVQGSGRGDQYVRIKIEIPNRITSVQKELLKKFEEEASKKHWF